jgi:ethanolamine ammonia-lyase large subunit
LHRRDAHDAAAFAPVAPLTVGGFRDRLLAEATTALGGEGGTAAMDYSSPS